MQTEVSQKKWRNDGKLYSAVSHGYLKDVVDELSIGDVDLSLTFDGKSFLAIAGERGFKEIARMLILHGSNPNEVKGKRKHSLLHSAALSGNYGFASVLLEQGANPSIRNSHDATPLHFAARMGNEYFVRMLVDYKADVISRDSLGRTPIQIAFQKGHPQIARILTDVVADGHLPEEIEKIQRRVAEDASVTLSESKLPSGSFYLS